MCVRADIAPGHRHPSGTSGPRGRNKPGPAMRGPRRRGMNTHTHAAYSPRTRVYMCKCPLPPCCPGSSRGPPGREALVCTPTGAQACRTHRARRGASRGPTRTVRPHRGRPHELPCPPRGARGTCAARSPHVMTRGRSAAPQRALRSLDCPPPGRLQKTPRLDPRTRQAPGPTLCLRRNHS